MRTPSAFPTISMPRYELSQTYYFRENGQKLEPGDTVELTEEQADEHNQNNPGLLKLVRQTTQGAPTVVRTEKKRTIRSKK